uniref:Fam49b protein n=1 Tax=Xenopus tropicalis TaxID=8364 RepID=Q0VFG0_XENTR
MYQTSLSLALSPLSLPLTPCRRPRVNLLSCCLDAQPSESEKEVYNQVNVVLKDAEGILDHLQSYRGAGHEIREVSYSCSLSVSPKNIRPVICIEPLLAPRGNKRFIQIGKP